MKVHARNPFLVLLGVLCFGALAGSAHATTYIMSNWQASGAQEVPANGSAATGTGIITVNTDTNILHYDIAHSGLANETAAHIHGPAARGMNAGVLLTLPAGTRKVGDWNYPESREANILGGQTYIDIHTTAFPGGEIRGQIEVVPYPLGRIDVIGATGGVIGSPSGGTILRMTVGQPVMGVATSAGGAIIETAGFWHAHGATLVSVDDPGGAQPALAFALMPIAPNPTVRNATIRYVIPGSAGDGLMASVRVFDITGRLVRVVASGPHAPGAHTVSWDGRNSTGARLGAGVFFVELAAGSNRSIRRVILLR